MKKLKRKKLILIIVSAVLILGVFSALAVITVKKTTQPELNIEVSEGTIVYDNSSNPIKITTDGFVKKNNKKYYAYLNNGKTYDLGEHSIIYTGRAIRVLGGAYMINKDGDITKVDDEFEFDDFANGSMFKLCDRKYLLASQVIEDVDNRFSQQENYMYIVMDTVGNAKLSSVNMTLRSTQPTILNTANFKFDVANEAFSVLFGTDELKMNLGNLIGSSVKFDSGTYKTIDEDDTPDDIIMDLYAGDGGNGGNGADGGNGANGGNGGNGADGGNGGNGGDGADGGGGGLGNEQEVVAYIVNKRVQTTSTTITCDYYYEDPFGKLGTIYIELHEFANLPEQVRNNSVTMSDFVLDDEGLFAEYWENFKESGLNRYECNFYEKQTTFKNLKPNCAYYILLCRYYENSTTEETEFELIDCVKRSTLPYQSKVGIQLLGPNYIECDIELESLDVAANRIIIPNTSYEVSITQEELIEAVETKITKRIEISEDSSFMNQTEYITIQVVDIDDNVICQTSCKNNYYLGNTL